MFPRWELYEGFDHSRLYCRSINSVIAIRAITVPFLYAISINLIWHLMCSYLLKNDGIYVPFCDI